MANPPTPELPSPRENRATALGDKLVSPLVSVVIPTKDSAETLARTLESVERQTYPFIEIVVVDNQSQDGTMEIARSRDCRVLAGKFSERTAQLNAGVHTVSGDYFYRIDADFILEPQLVEEAVSVCESKGLDGVLIHNASDPSAGLWGKVRKLERDMYRDDDLNVAVRFIRTQVLKDVGGFDERMVAGDDYDLHRRLIAEGARIGRITCVETHIGEPRTLREVWLKHFYYGHTVAPYIRKYGWSALRQLSPVRPAFARHWRQFWERPRLASAFLLYELTKYSAGVAGILAGRAVHRSTGVKRQRLRRVTRRQYNLGAEAVVVAWNSGGHLKECVEALTHSLPPSSIHIVDNGSQDGSISMLPGNVDVIRLHRNLGFGRAVNRVLPKITREVVLIQNPDARIPKEAFDSMMRCFEDPTVGAVQPLLLQADGSLDSAGSFFTWSGFLSHPGHGGPPPQYADKQPIDVFSAKGAAFLVRASDLRRIDGFDDSYFLYFEDTDVCWRLWLSGKRVVLCPSARATHFAGHSVHQRRPWEIEYHSFRNRITTLVKNLSITRLPIVLPTHLAICIAIAFVYALSGRWRHATAILSAIGWNIRNLHVVLASRRAVQEQRVTLDGELFRLSYARGIYVSPGFRFARAYLERR